MRRAFTRIALGLVGPVVLVGALGAATASADPSGGEELLLGDSQLRSCGHIRLRG
jgi:hypothetical protein